MDVVGGHRVDPRRDGEQGQRVVAGRVEGIAVVPQLDGQGLAAERLGQAVQLPARRRGPRGDQGGGDRAPCGSRSGPSSARRGGGQVLEGEDRPSLLPAGQVGIGERRAEAGVALGVPGQHAPDGHRSGSASPVRGPAGARVTSAPKTVGSPRARAASAKRTTP